MSERRLAAIMFTDIVGYTSLMGKDEDQALELLHKNRNIHKPLIEKHKGKWIKEMGDGVLASFDSAYNAVRCAIEIQQTALEEFNGKLRIGLHMGEIIVENDDIFGDGVNVASRIETLAEPGGIYFTEAIKKAIHNRRDVRTRFLADVSLKNVDERVKVYCVVDMGISVPDKEKIKLLKELGKEKRSGIWQSVLRPIFLLPAVFALAALLVLQYLNYNNSKRMVDAIAILPFANFTGNADEQYFVDMMHDAVIGELSKIGNLVVKSRTSTLQFRDTKLTIPEIAKILKVDAILESSVYKTGDSVYMQVQLIRAKPVEDHIWSHEYKQDTRYILSLYGDLAKKVAEEVEVQLSPQEEKRLTHPEEVNPEAYKAYLQGQFHWNQLTVENLDAAESYFNMARNIDPSYAMAYAGLASIGVGRAQNGLVSWHEAVLKSSKYLNKAMELDSTLAVVHYIWGVFNCNYLWKFEIAKRDLEKAIEFNPNDAMSRIYYAHVLAILNLHEEALIQGEEALEIDPYNNLIKGLYGMTLNFCRKYNEAIAILNEIRGNDYYNGIALSTLRTSYHLTGDFDRAYAIWRDSYRNDSTALSAMGKGYETGGYRAALEQLAELMIARSSETFVTPWRICTLYTRAGLKDEALYWLEKAYDAHDPNIPYVNTDPIFGYMREDPRFIRILKNLELYNL